MSDIIETSEFILEAYELLGSRNLEPRALDAKRLPGHPGAFIAMSGSGELHLLMKSTANPSFENRKYRAIRLSGAEDFFIVEGDSAEPFEGRFAVAALTLGHEDLVSSFAMVAATLLSTLPPRPSPGQIDNFIQDLVRLLVPGSEISRDRVLGLWGELWTMCSASDPVAFATAWHMDPQDPYDFSFTKSRLEIKTTTRSSRHHEFALDQLEEDSEKATWIGSLTATQDSSGSSVLALLEGLLALLPSNVSARVNGIALESLDGDIEAGNDFTFAPVGATPFLVYDARVIPRVQVPRGEDITQVRFQVGLDPSLARARSLEELHAIL